MSCSISTNLMNNNEVWQSQHIPRQRKGIPSIRINSFSTDITYFGEKKTCSHAQREIEAFIWIQLWKKAQNNN